MTNNTNPITDHGLSMTEETEAAVHSIVNQVVHQNYGEVGTGTIAEDSLQQAMDERYVDADGIMAMMREAVRVALYGGPGLHEHF